MSSVEDPLNSAEATMSSTEEAMSSVTQGDPTYVTSVDGTKIAVFISGSGRPLVLVPGTSTDHTSWRLVAPLLAPHLEVIAADRRGYGASDSGSDYSIEREYEDLEAVIDAAASGFGGPVDVLGHGYGGTIAFTTALLTPSVRRIVLYEAWDKSGPDDAYPPQTVAHLDALISEGQYEEALETYLRRVMNFAEGHIADMKASPGWHDRVAAARAIPRDLRASGEQVFEPLMAARLRIPVLLLVGSESSDATKGQMREIAAALPDARTQELEGPGHIAHLTAPELLASTVLDFLAE